MKQNFTNDELAKVVATLGSKLQVSVNRAGNIKIANNKDPKHTSYWGKTTQGFWTFYHNQYGYLFRRMDGTGYAYPLNMVGRKDQGEPFIYTDENGKTRKTYYRPYDIDNSYFKTFDEALTYFVKYLKKYRNINI